MKAIKLSRWPAVPAPYDESSCLSSSDVISLSIEGTSFLSIVSNPPPSLSSSVISGLTVCGVWWNLPQLFHCHKKMEGYCRMLLTLVRTPGRKYSASRSLRRRVIFLFQVLSLSSAVCFKSYTFVKYSTRGVV
jgi:hypothetical protein